MDERTPQKDTCSSEEQFLEQLKVANEIVAVYLRNSQLNGDTAYDQHDLFRIAMNSFKTPEEKLSTGIRRRLISGV